MSIKSSPLRTGALLAAGAAALVLSGCSSYGESDHMSSASAASVHCMGVNSCKGTSECKTAENACKGMNSCKGHGFLSMSEAECKAKGGTVM
jgi:hypothetical protein